MKTQYPRNSLKKLGYMLEQEKQSLFHSRTSFLPCLSCQLSGFGSESKLWIMSLVLLRGYLPYAEDN